VLRPEFCRGANDIIAICCIICCCCCCNWASFVAICCRVAFTCVLLASMVAAVCSDRFAICKLIVPAIVSAVSLSATLSSLAVSPVKRLPSPVYPPCADVIVPNVMHHWFNSWMNGRRLIHIWSALGLRSQSLRSCMNMPLRVSRLMTFIIICSLVYGTLAIMAIS
jgi:hypothetical protein